MTAGDLGSTGREAASREPAGRPPVGGRLREFQASRGGPGGGRRERRAGGERAMVPRAEFTSYYGRPILKAPVWRHDIAAYLFTGGLAAASSMIAAGADLTGRPALRRAGRLTSLAALGASTYFLINDLGRPERFHHMLRVAKPTSPMSVGTWILSTFGVAAGVAAVSEAAPLLPRRGVPGLARRVLPPAGRGAGLAAFALGPPLATYTAVLLADTAVPSWNRAYPYLPFVFAGSATAAASGIGLAIAPLEETGPVRRLAVAGAALEMAAMHKVEHDMGVVSEPFHLGRAGKQLRAARAFTVAGAVGALVGARSRVLSALSGASLVIGSALTRFGVFEAGKHSAQDPKYVVVPQRQRIEERGLERVEKVNVPEAD
ncbi:NrfD/PsrC family molybdoenzyme membrane anchor subunit [Planosporangium sp. 12N6]|uniref:NrfD/PsrC family molybdoenzyme membrane anchor subunit n=1 Tax=Planosporangium spinosum TaxID=3402278 RepID=UPI003CE7228A